MGVDDALAPLLDLPDIAPAVADARDAVDAALRHRALRRSGGIVAAEVSLRSAVASAALSGHAYTVEEVRAGTVLDPVVQGALRIAQQLPGLAETFAKAPRQVLARMHTVAASGVLADSELGRPVADPLVGARLNALCDLVVAAAGDPIVRAAVVHGELLALNAFAEGNGVVARAAARATLIGSGFDLRGLIAVDLGHREREPEYVGSAHAFATGTVDGVRSWLKHYAAAITIGAAEFTKIADEVLGTA
ncbi:MAG: oxidoreductase [Hamadaea sp.]|nr:oxidoreductase [Hamadaea sp.]